MATVKKTAKKTTTTRPTGSRKQRAREIQEIIRSQQAAVNAAAAHTLGITSKPVAPAPLDPIPNALDQLRMALGGLDATMAMIRSRLDRQLRPAMPEGLSDVAAEPPRMQHSPMVEEIEVLESHVRAIEHVGSDILNRLEV